MRKIKVGIIQQANVADLRTNLMNLAKSIEACAAHGAQLVVLQELHNSLYFCQTESTRMFDLAEPIPGPSTGFYSELAASNRIVLGLLFRTGRVKPHRACHLAFREARSRFVPQYSRSLRSGWLHCREIP